MTIANTSKLKRVMCGLLSTLTVLSGTAVAGTAITATTASAAEVTTETSAAKSSEVTPATFSWDNATVYFLLTDRFKNGDTSNDNAYGRQNVKLSDTRATFHGGDFAGITEKINDGYFNDLGVNAIWLTAPYEQIHGYIQGGENFYHYSYHGYYVLDYTETDAAYGTKEEFRELVDTAHEHGIRIIMDIVMNHAGYCSMYDMNEYDFGGLVSGWETFYNNPPSNAQTYQSYMDYENQADKWAKWWGPDWIRSSVAGYSEGEGGSELTQCLSGLPDFKTESTATLGIPAILQTKWTKEGTLSQKQAKYGSSGTVTDFITKWLSEWVREYGVDGFRCDTAKHVEKSSWKKLKDACVPALREWKQNNPDKALDDLDFWMTGEHWDHGLGKDDYYTVGGFDSMINFDMTGGGALSPERVGGKYNDYATAINNDDTFNALTFISSHDETLARSDDMFYLGSAFLMLPGAVQIYYGDETARPYVSGIPQDGYGGAGHSLRSDMNWNSYDPELLAHWGKVGNFRNNHIAVGGGANVTLTATSGVAFGRTYSKNGLEDKVAGVIGATANAEVTIDVSDIWSDGTVLENFYDDSVSAVTGGKVTFNAGAHGTILIQEPDGERGRVTVTHIDQDSGKTMKTETLVGLIGDAYTATPLDTLGYKLSKTVGSKTGKYSETEATVTFYYTFDSSNYAHIDINYVDAETGAEIAESDSQVGKIGSSYTTTAKSIKNYEVDTIPSNASGTVKSGTTTVKYKYNYVEPSNLQVHYYNANGWPAVNLYAYTEVGAAATEYTGKWPGASMTSEGNDWFYCDVPDTESGLVIFNNGGTAQEPGQKQPGYDATGEVWIKSGTVYPTGKVNVKYVGTDGKVLGSDVVKGMADGTTKYTTSAKNFSGYTLSSTPSNASGTFTEGSIAVTYTYTPDTPVNELKNNSTISSTSVNTNTAVTIKGAATGGTSPYSYTYCYKKSGAASWTNLGSGATATFKQATAGTYTVKVTVTDNAGNTEDKTFTVTVKTNSVLTNTSTISATTVNAGTKVALRGAATGGTGSYNYGYYYKKTTASTWTKIGTGDYVTFTPAAGTYNVKVNVVDGAGTVATKSYTLTVKTVTPLANSSTISATTVNAGTKVALRGAATGGTGSYSYGYYYKKTTATAWTKIGTGAYVTFTPAAGTYNVKVNVVDAAGTVAVKNYTLTVKTVQPLVNTTTISATTVNAGTKVALRGAATGGTGSYSYGYYYKKTTATAWTKIGTGAYVTFTPAAGTYNVKVNVVDAAGTVAVKNYTLTVKTVQPLVNTTTISATTVNAGTKVALRGAATGGVGSYSYGYYYKKTTATAWTKIGTGAYVIFTPAAGTYNVKVNVLDGAGTVAAKTYTLTVKTVTPLANTSTITATSIDLGSSVTIKGAATGGTGTYSYGYYCKKSTATTWTKLGTGASAILKPTSTGNYDVKINVVDGNNTVATKTFTLSVKSTAALANTSTISASSINAGGNITIKGAATGGTGTYSYGYYYKKSTATAWTKLGTGASATFTTTTPGNYDIKINVVDGNNTVAAKVYSVTVKATSLTNTSTVSATSASAGTKITIKGAATGGTAPYTYAYYYRASSASSWTAIGTEYGTATSVTYTPSKVGTYSILINVRDNTGEMVSKTYTVTVK